MTWGAVSAAPFNPSTSKGEDMKENIIRIYARTPKPFQFEGFLWPTEPIIFPESFLTPVHRIAMIKSPQLAVEISSDDGENWEAMKLADEGGDAGRPPTGVPAPSAEALVGAREMGIVYTPPSKETQEEPGFDVLGVPIRNTSEAAPPSPIVENIERIDPLEGICLDCGQFLKSETKQAGHKSHKDAGEPCKKPRKSRKGAKKSSAQFLAGGVDKD
jgi:hypothetical protein